MKQLILYIFIIVLLVGCENIPTNSNIGLITGTVSIYDLGFQYPADDFVIYLCTGNQLSGIIAEAYTDYNGEYTIYFDKNEGNEQAGLAILPYHSSNLVPAINTYGNLEYHIYFENLNYIENTVYNALFIKPHPLNVISSSSIIEELEPVTISWQPISPFPYKVKVSSDRSISYYYTENSNYTLVFPENYTNSTVEVEINIFAYSCSSHLYDNEWKSETISLIVNDISD